MISVICPVYNEEKHMDRVLDFFSRAKPYNKELLVVDGGSTDKTVSIFKKWEANPGMRLLHNPKRFVPFALNQAIGVAKGDIIVRIDAHSDYEDDYFEKILETFAKTGADIVGGPMRTVYLSNTQEAVAYATCTPFAIGDSKIHQVNYEGYTDSVTYGSWRKQIFSVTGLFDETLKRNQDDEFHYRARNFGFSIYQSPAIKLYYYPRNTFKALFKQYYEYGLFKPLVLKKVNSGLQWRHLVPAAFVLYIVSLVIAIKYPSWLIPLAVYLLADVVFTIKSRRSIAVMCRIFFVYPVIHFAYGIGFISGLKKIF